jgi:SPP1 family predicted phage head-tail adaptor
MAGFAAVTAFSPSALRHRLALERPERVSDEAGGFAQTWVEEAELWADLRPVRGREDVEAGRLAGAVTHEIALRWRAGVLPEMRFRRQSRVFHIQAVIDSGERLRWLKCLCEEREL